MNNIAVQAGDVVVTDLGIYQHWSIVSDRLCSLGNNLLISATDRTGTVKEESWDVVTGGKHTYVAKVDTDRSVPDILASARSQIGSWDYSVTGNNCEHFVKWSSGLKITSKQVTSGVAGAVAGGALVTAFAEKPTTMKILGGALLIGGLAVLGSKASKKKG